MLEMDACRRSHIKELDWGLSQRHIWRKDDQNQKEAQ
jgi:hypothetical protein